MFPLPILTYVKIGICALLLCTSWYFGYSFEASRFERYKADQITKTHEKEREAQVATDQIRTEKDAQIKAINNQLADALVQLRNRPSRPNQVSDNGQSSAGCTGAQLYQEDSDFLQREATRAETIRIALKSCYAQYDEVTK